MGDWQAVGKLGDGGFLLWMTTCLGPFITHVDDFMIDLLSG